MTRRAVLDDAARSLAAAGVAEPRRESRLLAEHALALTREEFLLRPDATLNAADAARLEAFVARRVDREPFAYVTGRREFWSLDFVVDSATLVPRPDSETLVEAVLANKSRLPDRPAILDLGTGSGCLLVALLSELPDAIGVGVDCSAAALSVARRNACFHGVGGRAWFVAADWGASLAAQFDLVVCNPPYIRSDDLESLAPEVSRHEPRAALSGGVDGLHAYRQVAPNIARLLAPNGLVAIELGAGMGDDVAALFSGSGLCEIGRRRDLAGCERCALFAFAPQPRLLCETNA